MSNTEQEDQAADAGHAEDTCTECLQTDNHPKVHYGLDLVEEGTGRLIRKAPVYHHDCTPLSVRREILGDGSVHSVGAEVTRAAFTAADKGVHGHKLRAHIADLHAKAAAAAPTTEAE